MRIENTNLGRRRFLRWAGSAGALAGSVPFILARPPGGSRPEVGVDPASEGEPGAREGSGSLAESGAPILRLDANENPYGLSPAARRAVQGALADANRYPIAEHKLLIDTLAGMHGLPREQVLAGCGSTEVIRAAVAALAAPGRMVLAEPTYEDPFEYSRPFGVDVVRVPLDARGAHDLAAMERAAAGEASLVYVCNPNNPTGTLAGGEALERFVRRVSKRAVVLVDEAYHDYVSDPGYRSMAPLAAEGLPVVVTRTFSKIHGMAGLRLGYALGERKLIERAAAHLTFAGASIVAIHAALASLEDGDYLDHCRRQNERAREYLRRALEARGYAVFPSQTNFVMFRLGTDVRGLISDMESRGIRIGRPFPPLTDHCRVSLGTPGQMERFVEELDRWRRAAAAA